MPGCSGSPLVTVAASMTGSTELGPIQPQQDSLPQLDDLLFVDSNRLPVSKTLMLGSRHQLIQPATPTMQRRTSMTTMTMHSGVQLTPLWEYVVRTKKFPKDADVGAVFDEILERLRDPEWEVRQHALRVLVDVLPTFGTENIDRVVDFLLPDLIENLGHPAPAVRKGSLDVLRVYLLQTSKRDEITRKIMHDGMNRTDVLDDYQTNVTTGVILATPLLLFPSRSGAPAPSDVVREATQALAMRLVQVAHQESALRSLARIRDTIGEDEFERYLVEVDESMRRNFELLCEVYGVERSPSARRRRPKSKPVSDGSDSTRSQRRRDSVEDTIKEVVPMDKSWDSEEDSDTSGIAEEDEQDNARLSSSASVSSSATRVVLETEIKFDEETAITMTILEEQAGDPNVKEIGYKKDESNPVVKVETTEEEEEEQVSPDDRKKTTKRVHFGGEIVKLRTPDSEDAESLMSVDSIIRQSQLPPSPLSHQHLLPPAASQQRTRIPLPVSPATRMPRQRPRSSSQPSTLSPSRRLQRLKAQRRSVSSSPRREQYTHRPDLSPKKSILARNTEIDKLVRSHVSRRDSMTSPRIVLEDIGSSKLEEPSFHICNEESSIGSSPRQDLTSSSGVRSISTSPALLGDVCSAEEEKTIDSVFGDRSDARFQEKIRKEYENMMRANHRTRSAPEQFDWDNIEDAMSAQGKDRRRSQSAKIPGFEVFPRQERNYILMELASPVKDQSRRTSLEDSTISLEEQKNSDNKTLDVKNDSSNQDNAENSVNYPVILKNSANDNRSEQQKVNSNKFVESEGENKAESEQLVLANVKDKEDEEEEEGAPAENADEDPEKSALDAKERSSDSSSDGEWKQKEPNWEELGLVDEEVLEDFHNQGDWRAQVRGLERIASALRTSSALTSLEPRLGSLLLAVLGGERCCRVAAAGLAVAKVVLAGISEDALKNRLPLIAWGLARHGGANAAQLARLAMLRVGAGLFLEKLLQSQCIGARNAKTRENTLQLLIFSLVTFPSTEFKVKSAIDKIVATVGDRRKRVRHSALETLAILSQIYDTEDILEASKSYNKGKPDGQTIHAAIKTRLSRKLLPNVSSDGLVVYGLQVSSNSQYTGADVDWIIAGSGSVSPGTGRTRGQLITMSKTENDANELSSAAKKLKVRPSSEHGLSSATNRGLLLKDERTSSWKLLPQSDENDKPRKKVDRTSKSADIIKVVNDSALDEHNDDLLDKESKSSKPYATPKRADKKIDGQDVSGKIVNSTSVDEFSTRARGSSSAPPPKQESRIPIYTGTRVVASESSKESCLLQGSAYANADSQTIMQNRRQRNTVKSAAPRQNYTISYANPNRYVYQRESCDDASVDLYQLKEDYRNSGFRGFKENQRVMSYEKLSKGFDNTTIKNPSQASRISSCHQYESNDTEVYETIYQRQRRLKENRDTSVYRSKSGLPYQAYDDYLAKFSNDGIKSVKKSQAALIPQKRNVFASPFDDQSADQSTTKTSDKDNVDQHEANGKVPGTRIANGGSKSATAIPPSCDRTSSLRHDGGIEARSTSSGSSSASNRSALSSSKTRLRQASMVTALDSDESTNGELLVDHKGDKAFDVISDENKLGRRRESDVLSTRNKLKNDQSHESSDDESPPTTLHHRNSSSANSSSDRSMERTRSALSIDKVPPIERKLSCKQSLESLLRDKTNCCPIVREDVHFPPLQRCNGTGGGDNRSSSSSSSIKSSPASKSSSERGFGARCNSKSVTDLNARDDSPGIIEESASFETLDFRNGSERKIPSAASVPTVVASPTRPLYDCNADSNVTLYSRSSTTMSPKMPSPKRFVSNSMPVILKDTDSDDTPPVPIGFSKNRRQLEESYYSEDGVSIGSHDELATNKAQICRSTPINMPKKACKLSPCRLRPQRNCQRVTQATSNNHNYHHHHQNHHHHNNNNNNNHHHRYPHHDNNNKHPEKLSKAVQQCLANLDSSAWEITLKGLRSLAQLARDEPEQLDNCAPGLLPRMLGKHVKNLRSQVARVACSTASDVFGAHVRGIDQDLDEVVGPLLHRTADTNKFLRNDCNVALDNMIEHFPPHRTIMTIANRGANHQNAIVHATTARLLYSIVNEIGPDCAMVLPREVRDKLLSTLAKLLTDGNLQARKHAKETFRLLLPCEGFRKALTDAVPESTLRLIDKTLRSI